MSLEVRHTGSAVKHRISRARSRHVVLTAAVIVELAPDDQYPYTRLLFVGEDLKGVMLEVVAIEGDGDLLVIHAMPLRDKYRHYLR